MRIRMRRESLHHRRLPDPQILQKLGTFPAPGTLLESEPANLRAGKRR